MFLHHKYVTEQVMEITLVNATVKCCDRIIATAEMKIAMAEEVKLQVLN